MLEGMLEISDLLQIDATIIAGILILLTITSLKTEPNPKKSFGRFTREQLTALVVLPFAASAIQLLFKSVQPSTTDLTLNPLDIVLPVAGFGYIIIIMLAIAKRSKANITNP